MKKYIFIFIGLLLSSTASAQTMIVKPDPEKILRETKIEVAKIRYSPVVSEITSTTAKVSIPANFPISNTTKLRFEYGESIVCIAIYPVPEQCKPKIINSSSSSTIIKNLLPGKNYYVRFIKDSEIRCIKAPCPSDEYTSDTVEFMTEGTSSSQIIFDPKFKNNLKYGSRGAQVENLQKFLFDNKYLTSTTTGYFGKETQKAVIKYQKEVMHIEPTGIVGRQTWVYMFGKK